MKIIFYWVLYPLIRPFYLSSLIINTLILSILTIIVSFLDRKGDAVHYIGKFWSLLNIYLSGTKLSIKGREKIDRNRTYIVMSNHQSLFDVWALIGKIPLQLRWIVKSEIKKIPFFGLALERMGHIYIDRSKGKGTLANLDVAVQKIKAGTSVVIFPEGTRSIDGNLQKFLNGGAILAIKSGVPILPITVNGGRFVLPKNTLGLMPGKIEIIVGDVIDPKPFSESQKDELMAAVKTTIEKNLDLEYGKI